MIILIRLWFWRAGEAASADVSLKLSVLFLMSAFLR